jgi:hypothetical protein
MLSHLAVKMMYDVDSIEQYCEVIMPLVENYARDLKFDLRKIICSGFPKIAKLLVVAERSQGGKSSRN